MQGLVQISEVLKFSFSSTEPQNILLTREEILPHHDPTKIIQGAWAIDLD